MSWNNPWQAIDQLVVDHPDHPYARLRKADIKTALDQFLDFMAIADHPYVHQPDKNTEAMTPVGTVKRTYAVPESMWEGAVALKERKSCLVVDFTGLKSIQRQTDRGHAHAPVAGNPAPAVNVSGGRRFRGSVSRTNGAIPGN